MNDIDKIDNINIKKFDLYIDRIIKDIDKDNDRKIKLSTEVKSYINTFIREINKYICINLFDYLSHSFDVKKTITIEILDYVLKDFKDNISLHAKSKVYKLLSNAKYNEDNNINVKIDYSQFGKSHIKRYFNYYKEQYLNLDLTVKSIYKKAQFDETFFGDISRLKDNFLKLKELYGNDDLNNKYHLKILKGYNFLCSIELLFNNNIKVNNIKVDEIDINNVILLIFQLYNICNWIYNRRLTTSKETHLYINNLIKRLFIIYSLNLSEIIKDNNDNYLLFLKLKKVDKDINIKNIIKTIRTTLPLVIDMKIHKIILCNIYKLFMMNKIRCSKILYPYITKYIGHIVYKLLDKLINMYDMDNNICIELEQIYKLIKTDNDLLTLHYKYTKNK
jgi:hypothetical protein